MSREVMQQALEALEYYRSAEDVHGTPADYAIDAVRAELAKPAPVAVPDGWKDFPDHVPPPDTECLVELKIGETTIRAVDVWKMQKECPVAWSSQTVETGYGWSEYDFEDVVRWLPLSATLAAAPQPPAPAVDVEAVRDVIAFLNVNGRKIMAQYLARAIGDER
jgi:hypothetical protein